MALIDKGGRKDGKSNYGRLFGNTELGQLLSRIHSAMIRSGYELEEILADQVQPDWLVPVEQVIKSIQNGASGDLPKMTVAFKDKALNRKAGYEGQADVVVFDHEARLGYVFELKLGDNFDTKKSSGELGPLERCRTRLANQTGYTIQLFVCCFHQHDTETIWRGLKKRFSRDQVMTGRELCRLLDLDYEWVLFAHGSRGTDNMRMLAGRLLAIPAMRALILEEIEQQSWLEWKQGGLFEEEGIKDEEGGAAVPDSGANEHHGGVQGAGEEC